MKCHWCKKNIENYAQLTEDGVMQCNLCGQSFHPEKRIHNYVILSHPHILKTPEDCGICNDYDPYSDPQHFKCEFCNANLDNTNSVVISTSDSYSGKNEVKCGYCSRSFHIPLNFENGSYPTDKGPSALHYPSDWKPNTKIPEYGKKEVPNLFDHTKPGTNIMLIIGVMTLITSLVYFSLNNNKVSTTEVLIFCAAVALSVVLYKKYVNSGKITENYSITRGMLAPQNKFYNKCVDDCFRNKTGDSANEQFLWTCTDQCEIIAMERNNYHPPTVFPDLPYKVNPIPDLTDKEYQRHSECFDLKDTNKINECYCMKDISTFCEQRVCNDSFDKNGCITDCITKKSPDCKLGLFGGWRP